MIGEKTMKDLKKRIVAQVDEDEMVKLIEQDLNIFFDEVRLLKVKILKLKNEVTLLTANGN